MGPRAALAAALLLIPGASLPGQATRGTPASVAGAAALGAYSGSVLGLVGAVGPCNRLLSGAACPRVAAAVGGTVGLAAGAVLGGNDRDAVGRVLRTAGYGGLAGGLAGWGLSKVVRQYGWPDPLVFAAVGAAIGASPEGAGVGFAAGAAVGVLGWMTVPRVSVGDAISLALTGLAVGGIVGWVSEAASSRPGRSTPSPDAALTVRFRVLAP